MSSPRDSIKSVRDYEKFLRSRGFSLSEAKRLAGAYKTLENNGGAGVIAGR
ncbi:hypothetical protein [Pseudomonas psychrophila]|uniref:hypothetical protein n=1 Tax=Pseudomonas psychrophila TaxID=122355 RepID=UPI000303AE4B|nr:hypothetical protein [Pseudomonas psychrophila]